MEYIINTWYVKGYAVSSVSYVHFFSTWNRTEFVGNRTGLNQLFGSGRSLGQNQWWRGNRKQWQQGEREMVGDPEMEKFKRYGRGTQKTERNEVSHFSCGRILIRSWAQCRSCWRWGEAGAEGEVEDRRLDLHIPRLWLRTEREGFNRLDRLLGFENRKRRWVTKLLGWLYFSWKVQ